MCSAICAKVTPELPSLGLVTATTAFFSAYLATSAVGDQIDSPEGTQSGGKGTQLSWIGRPNGKNQPCWSWCRGEVLKAVTAAAASTVRLVGDLEAKGKDRQVSGDLSTSACNATKFVFLSFQCSCLGDRLNNAIVL